MANVFAGIQAQHFAVGGHVTGVAPDGVDSEETRMRGRYRKWVGCADGGRFAFYQDADTHRSHTGCLRQIAWNLDGMSDLKFSWVDMDGFEVMFAEPTTDIGLMDLQQVMLFVPKGYLKIVANGHTKADAGIVTWWEYGAAEDAFTHMGVLGSFALP